MQNKLSMLWKAFLTGALMLIASATGYSQVEYAPTLIFPQNENGCVNMKYTFVWQEEVFANYYVLQIAKDAKFENMFFEQQVNTYKQEITFPEELRNTTFFWRVFVQYDNNVLDGQKQPKKDTSLVWSFSTVYPVAQPIFPVQDNQRYQTDITLSWTKPVGTKDFRVQVSSNIDFSAAGLVLDEVVNDPYAENDLVGEYKWKAPKNYHTYYWRVRSERRDDNCGSEWSQVYRFRTAAKAPKNLEPKDNATGHQKYAKFKWTYYGDKNDGYILRYSTSPKFETGENTNTVQNIADTTLEIQGLANNTVYYWQVAAMVDGSKSDWSEVTKFTTKYSSTTIVGPKKDEDCVPMSAKLMWNEKDAARGYSVEVRTSPVADAKDENLVKRIDYIKDTYVVVDLPEGKTKYFWRVKLKDEDNESDWSEFASFITTYAHPAIVTPAANATNIHKNATFSWSSSYKDVQFMIEIADVKDSLGYTIYDVIKRDTVDNTKSDLYKYEYELKNYYETYAWRVAAINKANCNGQYTPFTKFTTMLGAPELVSPKNEALMQDTLTEFVWKLVEYATNYEIQIAYANEHNSFDNKYLAKTLLGIEGNKVQIPGLKFETNYIWRVRAYNSKSSGEWSEFFAFKTSTSPAGVPQLIAPENKATKVDLKPTYQWKAAEKAVKYQLIVAQDPMFQAVVFKQDIDKLTKKEKQYTYETKYDTVWINKENKEWERVDSSVVVKDSAIVDVKIDTFAVESVELKAFQEHYWKVAAINVENTPTWSDTWTFRTVALKFEKAPNLIAPEDKSTNVDMDVKFEWQNLAAAERYHIQVSRTDDFQKVEIEDDKVSYNLRTLHMKDFGTTYFWRVRAINEMGEGPWSAPFTFTTSGFSSVEDGIVKFNVYPNPTYDVLRVSYNSAMAQDAVLYIVDASGKVVLTKTQALSQDVNSIELSVRHLTQGNYFLTIKANGEENTIRFTVIK